MDEASLEVVRDAQELFSRHMSQAIGIAYRKGLSIPCGKGCFACCFEPAFVGRQEVDRILHVLGELPADEQERVKRAVKAWYEAFDKTTFRDQKEMNVFEYRAAKLPCPLLKDGKCGVYEARPIACRGHVAVGERRHCEDDGLRSEQRYLLSSDMCAEPFAIMARHEDLVFDHLGILLYEAMYGASTPTAARCGLSVNRGEK